MSFDRFPSDDWSNPNELVAINAIRSILQIGDELISCETVDELCRLAVERCREHLGVDRCALFLREGDMARATYGTDMKGKTTDEKAYSISWEESLNPPNLLQQGEVGRWAIIKQEYSTFVDGNVVREAQAGLIGFTYIRSQSDYLGLFFNDNAITGRPLSSRKQEIIALYCSLVGSMLERKRDEEAAKKQRHQLEQAQRMEAVGLLAGGVAHDFNNILTSILGTCDLMLMDEPGESRIRPDLEQIRTSAERAATLTRQLLAFSRKQILAPEVLDLNLTLQKSERMLRSMVGEGNTINYRLDPDAGYIRVDRTQIDQIIMNIVVNARDAMSQGGTITIQTSRFALGENELHSSLPMKPGSYMLLEISDTGVGMTLEVASRAFDPYFSTKPKEKGTGLGLSTVYGIVTQSGGFVELETAPGHGSCFRVYFPEVEGEEPHSEASSYTIRKLRGNETVLLVEDDAAVRSTLTTVLRRHGYEVLETGSPGEAILICERHRSSIHIMVTDVVMPRMNGKELADRVKPLRPKMRVLFISGYSSDVISEHGILDPDLNFLQKPFNQSALLERVRNLIDEYAVDGRDSR